MVVLPTPRAPEKRGKHDEGADARSHCGVCSDRFLACYFVEGLRAPLPGDYLIGHLQFGLHQQDHERFSRGVLNSFKIFQAIVKPPSSFIFTTRKATSDRLNRRQWSVAGTYGLPLRVLVFRKQFHRLEFHLHTQR